MLKVGGKPQLAKYPGHDFFNRILRASAKNRGEYRQLCAQIAMLFFHRREHGATSFCDINREAIDTFYYKHLGFDSQSADAKRFLEVLKLLTQLLGDGKRKKIQGHEAIHLALLVDSLMDDYTMSWTAGFAHAFDDFRGRLAIDTKRRFEHAGAYWTQYGQLARTNSDRADVISHRHRFFAEKMQLAIRPVLKDATRLFGELEREIIYARDKKRCQVCDAEVLWSDAEIHHVLPHSLGGATSLNNGALVHKQCHPKGETATAAFRKTWDAKMAAKSKPDAGGLE